MKQSLDSSHNRASLIRAIFAAFFMLGGVALHARAGSLANQSAQPSDSRQVKRKAASSPGVPRFFNYASPGWQQAANASGIQATGLARRTLKNPQS